MLAQLTRQSKYQKAARDFCDFSMQEQIRTPKGLLYISKLGTLRHAANVAFVCLEATDFIEIDDSHKYCQFAKEQIDYMLGKTGKT